MKYVIAILITLLTVSTVTADMTPAETKFWDASNREGAYYLLWLEHDHIITWDELGKQYAEQVKQYINADKPDSEISILHYVVLVGKCFERDYFITACQFINKNRGGDNISNYNREAHVLFYEMQFKIAKYLSNFYPHIQHRPSNGDKGIDAVFAAYDDVYSQCGPIYMNSELTMNRLHLHYLELDKERKDKN